MSEPGRSEQDRLDRGSALPSEAGPPTMRRRIPAWTVLAILAAIAVILAVLLMIFVPNPYLQG